MAAELAPREVVPQRAVVTAVARTSPPSPRPDSRPDWRCESRRLSRRANPFHPGETPPAAACQPSPQPHPAAPVAAPRASAEPLTADLRRLHVTVSKRFMEKLEAAKDALSHSHPGADVEAILEAGLDALLERAAKRKGLVERAAEVRAAGGRRRGGRQLPLRPGGGAAGGLAPGRGAVPVADGRWRHLRLDPPLRARPRRPVRAREGSRPPRGCRLLCRVHNDLAARQGYGDAWMDRFTGGTRGTEAGRRSRPRRPAAAVTGRRRTAGR